MFGWVMLILKLILQLQVTFPMFHILFMEIVNYQMFISMREVCMMNVLTQYNILT